MQSVLGPKSADLREVKTFHKSIYCSKFLSFFKCVCWLNQSTFLLYTTAYLGDSRSCCALGDSPHKTMIKTIDVCNLYSETPHPTGLIPVTRDKRFGDVVQSLWIQPRGEKLLGPSIHQIKRLFLS